MKRPRFASEIIEENKILRRRVRALRKVLLNWECCHSAPATEALRADSAMARGAK